MHAVQLYQDEDFLAREVTLLTETALGNGEPVLLVATDQHLKSVLTSLSEKSIPVAELIKTGRLTAAIAEDMMAQFVIHHWPDRKLFNATVGRIIDEKLHKFKKLFVYGEMVNLLWQDGFQNAAIRLEELWNELGKACTFRLACAYQLDFLDSRVDSDLLRQVCHTHSSAACSQDSEILDAAFQNAVQEILGSDAALLSQINSARTRQARGTPAIEGLLWLRDNLPATATLVLDRIKAYCRNSAPLIVN